MRSRIAFELLRIKILNTNATVMPPSAISKKLSSNRWLWSYLNTSNSYSLKVKYGDYKVKN